MNETSSSQIKLLIILDPSNSFNPYASEAKLKEVTVTMDKKWKVYLINSGKVQYKNLTYDFEVHRVKLLSSPDSILARAFYLVLSIFRGANLVKKHKVHLVMSKDGHIHLGLVAYMIKKITNRKCIIRVNEDDVLALKLFIKRLSIPLLSRPMFLGIIEQTAGQIEHCLFKHADWIVTHGPTDFERIHKITERVEFVPLWVDTQRFKPVSPNRKCALKRKLLGINDEKKVILFVGRLHPEKDVKTLLYAFRGLKSIHKEVALVMVGYGPEEKNYLELTEKLGIRKDVKFLGYIRHDKMPNYYNAADLYVLTSIWEELSNTIMEAMACGIPVVATDVGGNPYLIKDGETGLLVQPRNPDALSEKIAYALEHPDEMNRMALKALVRIRKFEKQAIGERYKERMITLISQKRS